MSKVLKDDVYDTLFRISQGDLELFKKTTSDFLQSVGATFSSDEKQREERMVEQTQEVEKK